MLPRIALKKNMMLIYCDKWSTIGIINPKFIRAITKYNLILERGMNNLIDINFANRLTTSILQNHLPVNKSWVKFNIIVKNSGTMVIEDFQILLEFENTIRGLANTSPWYMNSLDPISVSKNYVSIGPKGNNAVIIQKDFKIYSLNILTPFVKCAIKIKWKLIARHYDKSDRKSTRL